MPRFSVPFVAPPMGILRLAAAGATIVATGCAQPKGAVFAPLENPVVFPAPPDLERIVYVGELATELDLKPAKSALAGLGEALFGKPSVRSMLSPYAVCRDDGSRLFVGDSNAQVVHVFDLEDRSYEQWSPEKRSEDDPSKGTGFGQPVGLAYDPTGRLFVADSVDATIAVFDDGGRFLGKIGHGAFTRPCGLAYQASTDRLYVADAGRHQVMVLSPDGTQLATIGERGSGPGQFNFPTNVALDATGRLFVSDSLNFRVQVFDPEGRPVGQIGQLGDMPGYFAQPKGLAVDSENHVYVVDAQFEAVQIFTPEGQLLLSFGEEGSGPGQFWLPAGICIDLNDRIWIADSYNRRVQVFDYRSHKQP